MGLKTSLALMLAFIVLGTFALFDPLHTRDKAELKKEQDSRVFWLKDKLLEKMKIHAGKTEVELVCAKPAGCTFDGTSDWLVTQPVQEKADPASVGALTGSIMSLTQTEKFELDAGTDPKEYGFDAPSAELEFQVKGDAVPYALKVGSAKAIGSSAYIQTNRSPNTVFMVANYFPAMLQKDLFHWRNKRIFPESASGDVSAIEWIDKTGQKFSAAKKDNVWRLESPVFAPANSILVEGLATTLVYLDMKGVFSESRSGVPAKKALSGKPAWKLAFANAKGEWSRVAVYSVTKEKGGTEFVVDKAGEPRLLTIDGLVLERFNKPLIEYRERRLIVGDELSGATEVALIFPKEKKEIVLKPEAQTWVYTSGDKPTEALSRDRIDSFLRVLSSIEANNLVKISADPMYGAFTKLPADLELEFRSDGKVKRRMRFAIHKRQEILTESLVPGELAVLSGAFLKLLPVRMHDLYESANKQVVTSEPAKEGEHGEHSHPDH